MNQRPREGTRPHNVANTSMPWLLGRVYPNVYLTGNTLRSQVARGNTNRARRGEKTRPGATSKSSIPVGATKLTTRQPTCHPELVEGPPRIIAGLFLYPRISLKTTTRTYDELLERTGGKQTIRVQNIDAHREALPLRRIYEADVVEPLRALQLDRVDQAREAYQARKGEMSESGLSMEDRLEAGQDALRAMRSAVTAACRELRPQPFGDWLRERKGWRA